MAEIDTVGILDEIQALVSDRLQVVTYKWLSRNCLVPSNVAKKLLQKFVEKHGAELEIVYSLSGWLKNNSSTYHTMLVSQYKLAEAKREFEENCSLQVYSVQACLPKDPAVIWNAEFVQAEELFKQPPAVNNCLRDNRFSGVSCPFVMRNTDGTHASTSTSIEGSGVLGQSRNNPMQKGSPLLQPQQKKVQQSNPTVSLHSPNVVKDVKNDNGSTGIHEQSGKPGDKGKLPPLPVNKKRSPNDKNSSESGCALANMWGRASAKSKDEHAGVRANHNLRNYAETQLCAREQKENDNSDDDITIKRASNGEATRKRRVILDYSDEDDDSEQATTLASPVEPVLGSKQNSNTLDLEKNKSRLDKEKENRPSAKHKIEAETKGNRNLKEESSVTKKVTNTEISSPEATAKHVSAIGTNAKDTVTDAGQTKSSKRKKVLKTRIDERGREVTEVVWEGAETETRPDCQAVKKFDNSTANASNRQPAKKSPAVGTNAPVGKAGNKKAGKKDPKQGNLLSFFRKV